VALGVGAGVAVSVGTGTGVVASGVAVATGAAGVAGGGTAGGGTESAGRSETMTQLGSANVRSSAHPNDKQVFMISPLPPGDSPVPPSRKPPCYHAHLASVCRETVVFCGADAPERRSSLLTA
jgi:hypothetical protein